MRLQAKEEKNLKKSQRKFWPTWSNCSPLETLRTLKTKTSQHQRINVKNENISSINQPISKILNIVEGMKKWCHKNITKCPPPGVTWGQAGTGYHWAAVGGVGQQNERLRLAQNMDGVIISSQKKKSFSVYMEQLVMVVSRYILICW